MKRKTNFDRYLEAQLKDSDFTERFQKAGEGMGCGLANGRSAQSVRDGHKRSWPKEWEPRNSRSAVLNHLFMKDTP